MRIAEEASFPDQELLGKVRSSLARISGKPIGSVLKAQESASGGSIGIPVVAKAPSRSVARPDGIGVHLPPIGSEPLGRRPAKDVAQEPIQRPPQIATPPPPDKTTGSQTPTPQLDEEQRAFLGYIIAHPDTPISAVYKAVEVSVWKGEKLRDALKEQGLLQEVAVSREGAGRPTKFFIPTFQAFALLGVEPPTGRGGAVHRYIQHLVAAGARAKGYSIQVEKELGSGAIADVHLERDGVKIACEIAVVSTPGRELAHIKHCLRASYDLVFAIFADETLLERTQELIHQGFSGEERSKVRLLPVSKLSGVG
jgi:hypothetical protein